MQPAHAPQHLVELSDEELARSFQQGSKEAGDLLFARHRDELKLYALNVYRWQGMPSAEDLVQEAYLVALGKFEAFKPYNYIGWMKRIIKNIAMNWIRADTIRDKHIGTEGSPEDINRIEGWYAFAELLAVLAQALAHLDETHHKVGKFMLDYFAENQELPSVRQIALGTDTSHGTAERSREHVLEVWEGLCKRKGFWPLTYAQH